jgi:hypothetical protein
MSDIHFISSSAVARPYKRQTDHANVPNYHYIEITKSLKTRFLSLSSGSADCFLPIFIIFHQLSPQDPAVMSLYHPRLQPHHPRYIITTIELSILVA